MTKCCFCRDDIENHTGNLPYPDGATNRWLCGTCVKYAVITEHLRAQADIQRAVTEEVRDIERKAEELATGVCIVDSSLCRICSVKNGIQKMDCPLREKGDVQE